MAKNEPDAPPEKVALYDKLLAAFPDVERKGAGSAYTSLNGHMTSFMTEEGRLALRLPAEYREALLEKNGMEECRQHGSVMSEYVLCSHASLQKPTAMKKHFAASLAYIGSLKPKPTKRKKAAKKAAKKVLKKKPALKKPTTKPTTKPASSKKVAKKKATHKVAAKKR